MYSIDFISKVDENGLLYINNYKVMDEFIDQLGKGLLNSI